MANGETERSTVMEDTHSQIKTSTRVNLSRVIDSGRVDTPGLTVVFMRESGRAIR
jgi:hypothetical protein